jgi:hypothetical protein
MPRVCTICTHAEKPAINAALVAGEPNRRIAAQYAVSEQAVRRHREDHLPAVMVKSEQAKEVTRADDLLGQLTEITARTDRLYTIADGIIGKAAKAEDWRTALMAVREASNANREARANLELLGELLGELNRQPQVNITLSAEWIEVRAVLYQALADYPEARAQVALALQGVNNVSR